MAVQGLTVSGSCAWPCIAANVCPLRPRSLHLSSTAVLGRNARLLHRLERSAARKDYAKARQTWRKCGIQNSSSSLSAVQAGTDDKLVKVDGIKLYDPRGGPVSLVSLWENRIAFIAFARHFGCLLCWKRADLLQARKAEMDAAGVALLLIAPGSPEQARKFLEQTKFSGEVYADPDHTAYNALEFVNGANSVLNSKALSHTAQAFNEGYKNDWKLSLYKKTVLQGWRQQGGIIVAGPGTNTLRHLFKDEVAGDEPNLDQVISACCSLQP